MPDTSRVDRLSQKFFPDTLSGWAMVAGSALAAQVLGQGLIAYALAHLRPTFSSLGLLVQTLGAVVSAWLVLGERLSAVQIVGGLVIVGGIALARSARKAGAPVGTAVSGSEATGVAPVPAAAPTAMAEPAAAAATNSLGMVRD